MFQTTGILWRALVAALTFSVSAVSAYAVDIDNQARATYGSGTGSVTQTSNQVRVSIIPPTLQFFFNSTFSTPAIVTRSGDPLFLEANAPGCNASATTIETRTVVIQSPLTGDIENYAATETGLNTGIFRIGNIPTRDSSGSSATPQNGVVDTGKNDRLSATLTGCGSAQTIANVLIDPGGVVFDTVSNLPVPGAQVEIVTANAGICSSNRASVQRIGTNGLLELAPNPVTTGADGRFEFPIVVPGSYCLRVVAPSGFSFASRIPADTLRTLTNPSRTILGTGTTGGSYGGAFDVTLATGAVIVDIPVDGAPPTGALMVEKVASAQIVEIGEFLDYRVSIKNQTGAALTAVQVIDNLPAGFAYEPGTTRLKIGGAAPTRIADPSGNRGPRLVFAIGDVPASTEVRELTYRVRTGPGANAGDATNRAQSSASTGGGTILSNVAAAKVRVIGGVFSDRGFIIGKVFLDCNRSRVQDDGELGIPGVRIYMEDGSFVVSDSEGKYSFYGISPRTHVLKIDATTMPRGSELIDLSNRNAGDANSRFVDLKKGELHKANFAEWSFNAQVVADVTARRARAETVIDEMERGIKARISPDGKPEAIADVKALPASGILGSEQAAQQAAQGFTQIPPVGEYQRDHPSLPRQQVAAPAGGTAQIDLEKVLADADSTLGFIELKDNDTVPYTQTNVRVKGVADATLKLRVNGEEVDEQRVGKRSVIADRKVQGKEYIGLVLRPGANQLELVQSDSFGNERGRAQISLIAPDRLGKLEIDVPKGDAVADGVSPLTFTVRLLDDKSVPVTVRTPITLEASLGHLDVEDLGRVEPGVQTFVEGGKAQFKLLPPTEAGEVMLRVTSGAMKAEQRAYFLPDLRPMIAAGVIEGVLNLRKLSTKALVPSRQQDGFDQELKQFAREGNDGKRSAAARAAVFLKGKVKGEYLLTLGYDSDKETRERLFRDIQPDEFYPVYGDSSIKGFDAQSTSKLYVRVDKQRSYLLYGDFTTTASAEARKLSNYTRSLTGVKEHYENGRVSLNAFASRDSTRQVVDEVHANGTSGPFLLSTSGALTNSERVEIITRDRNQNGIVLKSEPQTRFTDYSVDFEPISGAIRLLFRAPVPSVDANLNPISIRVTYEVDQGGKEFWVAGVDAQVKLNDRVEVGAVAVTDRNPSDKGQLLGANATVKLGEHTYVTGEFARSDRESLGKGDAARIELKHDGEKLKGNVYAGTTDEAFDNPGAWLSRGRTEAGVKGEYRVDEKTRILGEAIHTEDASVDGKRDGVLLSLERTLNDHLRVEVGVRHARESVGASATTPNFATSNEVDSLRLKVTGSLPSLPKATGFVEIEQDVRDSEKRVLAVGGEYQIADHAKAYARHEFISTINGAFSLNNNQRQNTTVFGLDTDYMQDGHLFSEYRMRDAISGREAEAAIGLRNLWDLGKGLRLNTNFERVHVLDGSTQNQSTALAVGLDYVGSDWWKGSTRLELRDGSSSDSLLSTVGAAVKLNRDWTFLGRNLLSITKEESGGERVQERLQLGMAYRDTDTDVWNALGKIEIRQEKDDTQSALKLRRSTQIVSLHGNFQPRKPLLFSARIASKWVQDESNGLNTKLNAQLVSGRMILELSKRWDLSVQASTHFSNNFKTQQYGLGLEVGYLLTQNLWLAGGYNFFGFEDEDLVDGDYTNPGWYARLRYKFDETLFGGRDAQVGSSSPQKSVNSQ